jgi:hypothetical protein
MVLCVVAASASDLTAGAIRGLLTRADPGLLALSVVLMTSGLGFLALRWRAMMPDARGVRAWPLTAIFTAGTLLHYALPGPVGEVVTAAMVSRRFGMTTEVALASGLHARFIGLAVAGTVSGVLFLTTDMPVPEGTSRWVGLATLAVAGGAVALGAMSAFPGVLRRLTGVLLAHRWLAKARASAERLADALGTVGRLGPAQYARGVTWAFCGHACVTSGIAVAAAGIGASPDPAGLAFTYTMTTAGAVVLFAFPGAQVGWDAMFASLLVQTAGLGLADAVAITVVVRAQQLLTVLLGGLLLLGGMRTGEDEGAALSR